MEQLNYCRQITKCFTDARQIPNIQDVWRARMEHVLDLCEASQKFMLPDSGFLIDDPEYRALVDIPELHLPYKFIALEFSVDDPHSPVRKHVVFIRERGEYLHMSAAQFVQSNGSWAWLPECAIHKIDYLIVNNEKRTMELKFKPLAPDVSDNTLYFNYLDVLMSFLNALQCSNVKIDRIDQNKSRKKIKTAIPFDTYHVLTIEAPRKSVGYGNGNISEHRSPREHLRRGHIVRPGEGRKPFWRNATVVCAGRGFNKVEKDYRIKNSSLA